MNIVRGISVDGKIVFGYAGTVHYNTLSIDIPVIYTAQGDAYAVRPDTIDNVILKLSCKNIKQLSINDVLIANVLDNDDKPCKIYTCIKEIDNSYCLCPFCDDVTKYKDLDKIKLEECEYVGPIYFYYPLILANVTTKGVVKIDESITGVQEAVKHSETNPDNKKEQVDKKQTKNNK